MWLQGISCPKPFSWHNPEHSASGLKNSWPRSAFCVLHVGVHGIPELEEWSEGVTQPSPPGNFSCHMASVPRPPGLELCKVLDCQSSKIQELSHPPVYSKHAIRHGRPRAGQQFQGRHWEPASLGRNLFSPRFPSPTHPSPHPSLSPSSFLSLLQSPSLSSSRDRPEANTLGKGEPLEKQ